MKSFTVICMLAFFCGCGERVEPEPVYTVYGTITCIRFEVSGRMAGVKIVAEDSGITDAPLYHTSCVLQGPQCEYSIPFVAEGSYNVFALIDRNNNMDHDILMPDSGDLVTGARPLMLWDKTQIDWPDSVWREHP